MYKTKKKKEVLEGKEYDMILHASMLESRERGTKYDHETCTAKI